MIKLIYIRRHIQCIVIVICKICCSVVRCGGDVSFGKQVKMWVKETMWQPCGGGGGASTHFPFRCRICRSIIPPRTTADDPTPNLHRRTQSRIPSAAAGEGRSAAVPGSKCLRYIHDVVCTRVYYIITNIFFVESIYWTSDRMNSNAVYLCNTF